VKNVHLVGHSLGAQVAGFVGRKYFYQMGEKIGRISGLDPARPKFEEFSTRSWLTVIFQNHFSSLSKEDATFVDIIHTSKLGIKYSVGHIDFFPNGGKNMPGCKLKFRDSDHARAYKYWIESIGEDSRFIAYDSTESGTRQNRMGYHSSKPENQRQSSE